MKNISVLLAAFILLFTALSPAWSQGHSRYRSPESFYTNSMFLLLGYSQGPSFEEYVKWVNNYYFEEYGSIDSMSDFSGSFDFSIGLRIRLSRYFASEFDFLTYSMKTSKNFTNSYGGEYPHTLELNVAIISASMMILFDFSDGRNSQLVVPFVASGVSVFPLRLDHRITYTVRHTTTSLAANFAAGFDIQITPKLWASLRGDWTLGKANIEVAQIDSSNQPSSFELDL